MARFLFGILVATALLPASALAQNVLVGKHITTQTTTALVAAVAGQSVYLYQGSICVDANGVTTGVAIVDTTAVNLAGTNVVWVLAPGSCLTFFPRNTWYFTPTVSGRGLSLITSVGNGPVEVSLEAVQR